MERVAIVARLKEGSEQRAADLVGAGPPFDLTDTGIVRHSIYISAGEAVFVFEGHEVEWIVDELIDGPFQHALPRALEHWKEIVDGRPRVARERFGWQLDEAETIAAATGERSEAWAESSLVSPNRPEPRPRCGSRSKRRACGTRRYASSTPGSSASSAPRFSRGLCPCWAGSSRNIARPPPLRSTRP